MAGQPARKDDRKGRPQFSTISGMELDECYGPEDVSGPVPNPGEYPFTRGVYPSMYRGKTWTMRQFAGFGSARDTNERFKYLLANGTHGLSTAFDMPTLMGYDADSERSLGEVGREGVAVSTIEDMAVLFDGIQLDQVTTSMTVNCSASILLAMYLVVAERQGCDWKNLGGTIQNDMFKEFIAQKEWICPPEPSLRIVTDMIEFCTKEVPRWHPVSISGYHIREAGSTAVQELAFTLAVACHSSSTPTMIFSKRSPRFVPRGDSGRRSCASASVRKPIALVSCVRTVRPPACLSRHNSP